MLHPRRVQQARVWVWVRSTAPLRGHFVSAEEPRHRLPRPQRLAAGDAAGRSTARRGWLAGPWWRERRRRGGRRKTEQRRPRRDQQPWQVQQRSVEVRTATTPRRGCLTVGVSRHGCPRPQTPAPSRPPGGRGRGGDVNRPAWMSNGPVSAMTGAVEGGTAAGETRATTLTSAVAAGRGRGRGANISISVRMASGDEGPQAAQAA